MNPATIVGLLMSSVLPALRQAADNPAVREVILNLVTKLLDRLQGQLNPRYAATATAAPSPGELPEIPHQDWTPEAVHEWAEAKASS